jgi:hypothetical protein
MLACCALALSHALPAAPSHHTGTPGGSVVTIRVPIEQLDAVQAIGHDIWRTHKPVALGTGKYLFPTSKKPFVFVPESPVLMHSKNPNSNYPEINNV